MQSLESLSASDMDSSPPSTFQQWIVSTTTCDLDASSSTVALKCFCRHMEQEWKGCKKQVGALYWSPRLFLCMFNEAHHSFGQIHRFFHLQFFHICYTTPMYHRAMLFAFYSISEGLIGTTGPLTCTYIPWTLFIAGISTFAGHVFTRHFMRRYGWVSIALFKVCLIEHI